MELMWVRSLSACALVLLFGQGVSAHGRLVSPPARSTMWRFGYNTPINYNDNELFCGGFQHQISQGYKCGVCGDPWDGPRDHEVNGKFYTDQIAASYKMASTINVKVQITANHKGWFEFKLCPVTDANKAVTHACLDKYPLRLADGSGTKYTLPDSNVRNYSVALQLPAALHCQFCVLQWRYHAGNNWGVDEGAKTGCLGCGYQEEFYGCANIAINGTGATNTTATHPPTTATTRPAPVTTTATTRPVPVTTTATTRPVPVTATARSPGVSTLATGGTPATASDMPTTTTTTTGTTRHAQETKGVSTTAKSETTSKSGKPTLATVAPSAICRGTVDAYTNWCKVNCPRICPTSHCICKKTGETVWPTTTPLKTCVGIGIWGKMLNQWCNDNCNHTPPFCPQTKCKCT